MSHVLRKFVFAIWEQQRRRSACAPTQSYRCLCYSLPRSYNTSSFYIRNFKPLANLCGCAGRFFESYLVANSEDRFSRDESQVCSFVMSAFMFASGIVVGLFGGSMEAILLGNRCSPGFPHVLFWFIWV